MGLLLALARCGSTISTTLPESDAAQTAVVLSAGDVVKVTFPGQPDYTQSQRIQSDGKINLPIIGEVRAAGQTVSSLQHKLEKLYGPELQDSEVVVTLDSNAVPVVIAGAVQKPAKYFFDRPTTVFQAVMEAGGPDQFGTLGRVNLIRLVDRQQRTEVLDLRPIMHGHPTKPLYVRAGDVIVVGESRF
jgi:polysaccharide export outer membrane protein